MITHPHKGRSGLDRMLRAAGYSIEGLKTAYRGESAFRQESFLAVVMLPGAFILGATWIEVAVLAGSVLLVLIVELLNSGIEAAIDRVSIYMQDLSKRSKDLASAAVFLSLVLCAGIWLTALLHRFG